MAKYLFIYHGGENPETEEEVAEVLDAWGNWLGSMGAAVIDGGNPVGMSSTVNPDGSVSDGDGGRGGSGYTIVSADSLDAAVEMAKGCPILSSGGNVYVYETFVIEGT